MEGRVPKMMHMMEKCIFMMRTNVIFKNYLDGVII